MGKFSLTVCPDEGCGCSLSDHDGYMERVDGRLIPACSNCSGDCEGATDTTFARKVKRRVDDMGRGT